MAKVNPNEQDPQARGGFSETPEEKLVWRRVRKIVREMNLMAGDTFNLKGVVTRVELAQGNKYFREERKDQKSGGMKPWFYVKVHCRLTDPRAIGDGTPLDLQPKKVGASFFNGVNRDGSRSPFKGGMYDLHRATFHEEPSQGLIDQKETWDTDDYAGAPLLLRMTYQGMEEEGSQYYGTKANMRVFVSSFDRDQDYKPVGGAHRDDDDDDDLDDDDDAPIAAPEPVAAGRKPAAKPVDEDDDDDF